ncbi:hypothetical protein BT96DRAFT_982194 [Gymnopus androsaceus JB14]|uniref:Uncharacterized protein n=1 Tax=Gymnopus androsaceus JB14 TaxID=1447944 RepID=A0A6A4GHN5_9AGAR|nr:hypothetical protein BT96DRAFT_982194 [Gymnopus androsaceus JB14]
MVTSSTSRRKCFMAYDASFDRPTRKPKTHTNETRITRLKKLPVQSRLEMNRKIMDRNKARREKACTTADDVSDVESLITIEDEEMDNIRSDPDVFALAKPYLDAATIAEMNRANREDAENRKEVAAEAAESEKESEFEPDVTLHEPNSTSQTENKFPKEIKYIPSQMET